MTAVAPQHIMNELVSSQLHPCLDLPMEQRQLQLEGCSLLMNFDVPSNNTNPKQVRHVRFAEDDIIFVASPLDQLNVDEINDIWFSAQELASIRNEAREYCRRLRMTATALNGENKVCTMALCSLSRGLESRACMERQRRKFLAAKCIVRAQSLVPKDRLAAVAQKCTRWASALAREEGLRDYVRAMEEEEAENDGPGGTKRSTEEDDRSHSERRVRSKPSTTSSES